MQKLPLQPHPQNIDSSANTQSSNLKSTQKPIYLDCEEQYPYTSPSLPCKPSTLTTQIQPWTLPTHEYYISLNSKSYLYPQIPIYFRNQPNITKSMRAILYDWMMEVCSELTLKRETFHLSIEYCDRYLSVKPQISKGIYQLVGLTCMYIAGKVEEVHSPCLSDWVLSADNGYSPAQVLEFEKVILKSLNFHILPVTCFSWANWLMSMWDLFIDFHFGCMDGNSLQSFSKFTTKKVKKAFEERMICFKLANQKAYRRFRQTFQILDLAILHPESLKFDSRVFAAGLIYVMISKYFFDSKYALLYYNGDSENSGQVGEEDIYQIEPTQTVQDLYENFICTCLELTSIEEIYPVVSFFQDFLEFPLNFDLPIVCKFQSKARIESHYEEFLSYQTHNSNNLDFIEKIIDNF